MTAPTISPRGRLVSWAGFVFGSVTSIAANILHTWLPAANMPAGWTPGIAPQIGAAVWPIGLLLSVEVLSRARWRRGWLWALARYGGAGTVAIGSAVISYAHLRDVLLTWGYGDAAAYVGPLVLDGLMVVSGFALLSMTLASETSTRTRESEPPTVPVDLTPRQSHPVASSPSTAITMAPEQGERTTGQQADSPDMSRLGPSAVTPEHADSDADTRRATARHLSDQGWPPGRIAAQLGVSKRTVRRYLASTSSGPSTANEPDGDVADPARINTNHKPLEGVLT